MPDSADGTTTSGPVVPGDQRRGLLNLLGRRQRGAAELPDFERDARPAVACGVRRHAIYLPPAVLASPSIARRTAS